MFKYDPNKQAGIKDTGNEKKGFVFDFNKRNLAVPDASGSVPFISDANDRIRAGTDYLLAAANKKSAPALAPQTKGLVSGVNIDMTFGRTKAESVEDPKNLEKIKNNYETAAGKLSAVQSNIAVFENHSVEVPDYLQKELTAAQAAFEATKSDYDAAKTQHQEYVKASDINKRVNTIKQLEAVKDSMPSIIDETKFPALAGVGPTFSQIAAKGKEEYARIFKPVTSTKDFSEAANTYVDFGWKANRLSVSYMSEDERNVFAYYLATDKDKANEYFNALAPSLNSRRATEYDSIVQESSKNDALQGVMSNVYGGYTAPAALVGTGVHVLKDKVSGTETPLDTNSEWFVGPHAQEASSTGIKSNVSSSFGKFMVDTGLSMAQFISTIPLGETAALGLLSSSAGGQMSYSVAKRGGSATQALEMGVVAAAAEYVTEKMSFDSLLKIYKAGGAGYKTAFRQTLANIAQQAGTEGLEEMTSQYIDNIGDEIVMGDKSQMNTYMKQLEAQGMSEEDAFRKAFVNYFVVDPLINAAGGAISGGMMGTGGSFAANIGQSNTDAQTGAKLRETWGQDYNVAIEELIATGQEYAEKTGSRYYADEAAGILENGGRLTDAEVGRLYRVNVETKQQEAEAYFKGNNENPILRVTEDGYTVLPTAKDISEINLRKVQNEYAEQLATALRKYNVKNVVVEHMPEGVTGRWENGVVYVSSRLDTAAAINTKVAHEISHAAQQSDSAFANDILDAMRELGRDVDSEIAQKKKTYTDYFAKSGKDSSWIADTVTDSYAADEVTADYIGELMKNDDLVKRLGARPTLLARIIEAINKLLGRNQSTKERAAYAKLADRLRKVAGAAENIGIEAPASARYSVIDSTGRELTPEQSEYFKNSKVRDKNGNLLVMFHNTNADFTVFDTSLSGKNQGSSKGAGIYLSSSSTEFSDVAYGKKQMTLYANIKVPFELSEGLSKTEAKHIVDKYATVKHDVDKYDGLYRKHATEQLMSGLRTMDYLKEYAEETEHTTIDLLTELGYDGIHSGPEWVAFLPSQVKLTSNTAPTENTDIRFSLKSPVEETKDLIAVHNLTKDKLLKALDLGGFPMPSIAVTRSDVPHTNFGDISLVFDKETINPADRRNKVYSADAWTPTFPRIEYETNEKVESRIYKEVSKLVPEYDSETHLFIMNLEDILDRAGSTDGLETIVDRAAERDEFKAAYLRSIGSDFAPVMREKSYSQYASNSSLKRILELTGLTADEINELPSSKSSDYAPVIEQALTEEYVNQGIDKENAAKLVGKLDFQRTDSILYDAAKYARNGDKGEVDTRATREAINERSIDEKPFKQWLFKLFDGVIADSGIYNGKEIFTPSGNRKSFKATHLPVMLENIVKAMSSQNGGNTKNVSGFNGVKTIRANTAETFNSIDKIKAAKGRIQNLTEAEFEQITNTLGNKLYSIIEKILNNSGKKIDNRFIAMDHVGEALQEAAGKNLSVSSLKKTMQEWNYPIDDETANEALSLISDISEMPVNMFEAKPERAVTFKEVRAAIFPSEGMDEIKKRINALGIPIVEYEADNMADRIRAVNSIDNVRFSVEARNIVPWEETEEQAQKAGYPVIDGKQVFPYKTWVHDKERGNYGLVVGLGNYDNLAQRTLIVSFWNKNESKRARVEKVPSQLEIVTGKYQPSDAELAALFETEPVENLRDAVSSEDWQEYRGIWNEEMGFKAGTVVSLDASELPTKAQSYLTRSENGLVTQIAKLMDVPRQAGREFLKPIVQEVSKEYLNTGGVSDETIDSLFDKAWNQGVIVNDEFYNQYKDLKTELRTSAVTLSEKDIKDFTDYGDWLKHQFGRLNIVKTGGLPVDVKYMELAASYPNLFPENITHPADQLRQMSEIAQSIAKTEQSHDKFYGNDESFFRDAAKHDFETVMMKYLPELKTVRKYYEQRARYEAEREKTLSFAGQKLSESDVSTIKQLWKLGKESKKNIERATARNLMTENDNAVVDKLLTGELTLDTLPDNVNKKGIREIYEAKSDYEGLMVQVREFNKNRKAALRHEADGYLTDAIKWKDKGAGFLYQRETMERNIYDVVKDKKTADEIVRRYFVPVHKNEAWRTKLKNEYRERVREMDISRKTQKGNKLSEAAAVQIYGEALDNIEVLEAQLSKKAGDDWRNGHTLKEWKAILEDITASNPNMNMAKIKDAVDEFRNIYNELFDKMNDARIRNGYEPVDYRRGYFPHFQNEQGDGILAKFGRALGIEMNVSELPTTINGLTHTFRPGIRWQGSTLAREGFDTVYDAVEGFDKYIEGVSDVICHTDDIQSLRALAEQIRYRSSDTSIREQIDYVREDKSISVEEKEFKLRDIYEHGKFTLSNFIVNLDEYTNLLANKKAFADRNMERLIGRKSYDLVKTLENRVAANMVSINPASWLTNLIPLTQGGSQLKSTELLGGMWDALSSYKEDDGFAAGSTFLTNRRGSDPLVRTWQEQTSATMSKPMQVIDTFVADSLVRGRYNHNRKMGMSEEESMNEADRWTAGVMADRSKGSMPTLFESRNPVTKVFTQFQLEVNNQLSYLFKDIPREQREYGGKMLALALFKFFLGAWLYNEIYEYFIGRRPALDPIGLLNDTVGDVTGYELPNTLEMLVGGVHGKAPNFKTQKEGLDTAGLNLAQNVAENLPFIGGPLGGGRLPISNALPNVGNLWSAGANIVSGEGNTRKNWNTIGKELLKPGAYILPPFGGGQLKKAYQGIKAVVESGRYGIDSEGRNILQYPVYNDNPLKTGLNAAQAALFGSTSLKTGQDWIDSGFKSMGAAQTAVYKELIGSGTSERAAYGILKEISSAEAKSKGTRFEISKVSVQRNVLNNSDLTPDEKNIIYYGLLASDKERVVMEKLDDMNATGTEVSKTLTQIQNIGSANQVRADVIKLSKTEQKVNALLAAEMTDEQKRVIYEAMISDSDAAEKRITACHDSGLGFDDFLKIQNTFAKIDNDDSLKVSEKAIEFIGALNEAAYSTGQIGTIGGAFLFRASMASTNALANFTDLTGSGVSGTNAAKILDALEGLEPLPGKEQVSDMQKMKQVAEMPFSEADKLATMQTILDEKTYAKINIAASYGVKVAGYVNFKDILPNYDADQNGSYKYAEVESALNSLSGLTKDQRAVLWQIQTGGKNNPYNSSIGAKIKTELAAVNDEAATAQTGKGGFSFDFGSGTAAAPAAQGAGSQSGGGFQFKF